MQSTKRFRLGSSKQTLLHSARAIAPLTVFVIVGVIALAHPTPAWASLALSAAALVPLVMVVAACYGSESRRPFRAGFAIAAGSYFLIFTLNPFQDASYQETFATSKAITWCYPKFFPDSPLGGPAPSARYPVGIGYGGGGIGSGGFGSGGFGGGGFGGGASSDAATEDKAESRDTGSESNDTNPVASDAASAATNPAGLPPIFSTAPIPPPLTQQQQQDLIVSADNFWRIGHSLWSLIFGWAGGFLALFLARRRARAPVAETRVLSAK